MLVLVHTYVHTHVTINVSYLLYDRKQHMPDHGKHSTAASGI